MHRIALLRRADASMCVRSAVFALVSVISITAHAVVVRGVIRDPLGRPIAVAHVQLVKGKQVVASTITLPDGSFEIRSTDDGRFLLIADAPAFFPSGQRSVLRQAA